MSAIEKARIPPEWLNEEFFTKALREGLKQPTLLVESCLIKPATAVGDNYASIMFRAQLVVSTAPDLPPKTMSVVCKTLPHEGEFKNMVKESEIFEKEARQLATVLPAINKLLKQVSAEEQPLCAELIYFGTEPEQIIILQDLKEQGFANLDRLGGLSEEASTLVLEALAKLHAGSLYLIQNEPELMKGLEECMWLDKKNMQMQVMLQNSLDNLIAVASEWNDIPADYIERLKKLKDTLEAKLDKALEYDEKCVNVLQHGDSWINNIMFSQSEGSYTGLRMVDFQITCINSAAMDLNYFIFTSPRKEIRLKQLEEMLQTYYNKFTNVSAQLGIDLRNKFSFDDLKREFRRRTFFGFLATIIVYPITITESKDALDVNDFFDEGSKKRGMYQSKVFKEVFQMVMPYFIECGVI